MSELKSGQLFFVDCEASGPCPTVGELTEFAAVHFGTFHTFYARFWKTAPDSDNPNIPHCLWPEVEVKHAELTEEEAKTINNPTRVMLEFERWIKQHSTNPERPIFVADNLAFDWQWINHKFHSTIIRNPFGYSGRRINDFYAGLKGNFTDQNAWKALRVTPHTHNPIDDALGNAEAFARILNGER